MNIQTNQFSDASRASREWYRRPADQRFNSLPDMLDFKTGQRESSRAMVISNRQIEARPIEGDDKSLVFVGPDGAPVAPTHWSFGQMASRVKAPAGYMRNLPSPLAADCLNYGLKSRGVEEIGALLRGGDGLPSLAAATGPNYGRVWDADVITALIERFGDGRTGQFTVPKEYRGHRDGGINEEKTTLFASDRDMFVFLADEKNRIEIPNRRNGQSGYLSRGFMVWNSEVGDKTLGISTFLFDYTCSNRLIMGMTGGQEIRIRHTSGAPDRFVEEIAPAIEAYSEGTTDGIRTAVSNARNRKFEDTDKMQEFLAKRFTKARAKAINLTHVAEENRPIETLWDAAVGITAYAKGMKHQDERVVLEREAGKIMALA